MQGVVQQRECSDSGIDKHVSDGVNKLLAKNQEELPTEETTTEPAAEPPVEITKNESADQAEDRGTRRGEGCRVHRTSWCPGER